MPIPPPPTAWDFAPQLARADDDLVGVGADLSPSTLFAAYSSGIFPMGVGVHGSDPIGWWCPNPRGILRPGRLRVTRSLRQSAARLQVRVDTDFAAVVAACADPSRNGRWITPAVASAYLSLHEMGWAHSVEVWRGERLVGGLYGVAIGGLFAGESMFHHERDASKVALMGLTGLLNADGDPRRVIDVQWRTEHLATLGVTEVSRAAYLALLEPALTAPLPRPWA